MTSIAFEMGAVFLLAGLLMFGSSHGLIPRSVRNIGAPVLICIALFGFLLWRFGPDLMANARANAAPWLATSSSSSPSPSPSPSPSAAEPSPVTHAQAPVPAKAAAPGVAQGVKGVVIREVVSAPAEPAQSVVPVIVAKPVEEANAKLPAESGGNSQYDSGVKKAVKSVGHFLHIGGKKKDQAPQP